MAYILPGSCPFADIYAITDDTLSLGRPVTQIVKELLAASILIIQYREKEKPAKTMLQECIAIKKLTEEANACFIVNDHIDIAILCDADGVHVGQDDLPINEVRKLIGSQKIIGVSTHTPKQAQQAVISGADYIGVGPIYKTNTKKDVCDPVTLTYLNWVAKNIHIPFVAIGGIKRHNIQDVIQHGAKCCALVSEIVSDPNIEFCITELRKRITASQNSKILS